MPNIDQITGAQVTEKGAFILPGVYKFQLQKCMFLQPRAGGEAFIAEFTVLESNNPFHQIGSKCTFYQKMNDAGPGAIKSACLRFMGYEGDPNQAPTNYLEGMNQALGSLAQNPNVFGSPTVECSAHIGPLKNGGGFTFVTFKVWAPPAGWAAQPTPKEPQSPQTLNAPPQASSPVPPPTAQPTAPPVFEAPPQAAPAPAPVAQPDATARPWTPPQG